MFGYAPGTFTGGLKDGKDGYIVAANGGTLFLDEIGDMPMESQTRLLRVLSERVVQPLGAANAIPVDFALICASHRDLQELVRQGRFREDLYYRVCGAKITLPALRERNDLIDISRRLLAQFDPQGSVELSESVWQKLSTYAWPGNIRQLKSTIQYIVYSCGDGLATEEDLPEDLFQPAAIPGNQHHLGSTGQQQQSSVGLANDHALGAQGALPACSPVDAVGFNTQLPLSRRDELLGALHQTVGVLPKPPEWSV